jgi:hypothetical protein
MTWIMLNPDNEGQTCAIVRDKIVVSIPANNSNPQWKIMVRVGPKLKHCRDLVDQEIVVVCHFQIIRTIETLGAELPHMLLILRILLNCL